MKTKAILFVSLTLLLTGCFAPVNLTYESARMLDEGNIGLQGSYSRYNVVADSAVESANLNSNFGFALGYGVSPKYTIKFRYERMNMTPEFNEVFQNEDIDNVLDELSSMNYFEIDNKIMLKDGVLALGLPIGVYTYGKISADQQGGFGWLSFDPRLYVTMWGSSDKFELTVIPKIHIMVAGFGGIAVLPGISLGMGLSSDLDKWAVRPEIGFDGFLSFGVGVNFNMNTGRSQD